MDVTIIIKDVPVDAALWHNNLVHPEYKHRTVVDFVAFSYIAEVPTDEKDMKETDMKEPLLCLNYNAKDDVYFMSLINIILEIETGKFCRKIDKYYMKQNFGRKSGEKYILYVCNPRFVIKIKHGIKPPYIIDTSVDSIDKIRRLFIAFILSKEFPTTIDYNILYYHLVTDEYKNIEYPPELKNLVVSTSMIYDHEKCLEYIKGFMDNLDINLEHRTYRIRVDHTLPKDLMNMVVDYTI